MNINFDEMQAQQRKNIAKNMLNLQWVASYLKSKTYYGYTTNFVNNFDAGL